MENANQKNAYVCTNLHTTVTVNKDNGVTPMFISCPVCNERAASMMYKINQALEPTHEWYKPTEEQIIGEAKFFALANELDEKLLLSGLKDHVKQGGLLMRKIKV